MIDSGRPGLGFVKAVKGAFPWLLPILLWITPVMADLKDPTKPPMEVYQNNKETSNTPWSDETASPSQSRWRVSMILISPPSATAVINDQTVHPGQEVDGLRVERIVPGMVYGREGDTPVTLNFPEHSMAIRFP